MSDYIQVPIKEAEKAISWIYHNLPALKTSSPRQVQQVVAREIHEMLPRQGQVFVRIAGISGFIAVALGAYGAHVFQDKEVDPQLKVVFESGNKYHFLHTLALLAVPLARRPHLVGTLMTVGMVIFSGSCYYHALTGSTRIRFITPYGGMTLMAAWLAFMW